jgi:hypothetical protein
MIKLKDINSNNKIRRAETRIEFLKKKEQNDWTLNEIDKLTKEIETQKRIVKKRNERIQVNRKNITFFLH